jgi:mono/diheme cytochrome c family protein
MRGGFTATLAVAGLSLGVFGVFVVESAASRAATDLFSPAQVKRGESVFDKRCVACHGKDLNGGEHAPPLVGDVFWENWKGKQVRPFYARIISTMPADDPGVVPPQEVLELVAYIFSKNGIPIGTVDAKSSNDLNGVAIKSPN